MNHLSDQALINLYLTAHQQDYFALLYTRHRRRVYLACLPFCEDPQEADDFTQEIFIRLTHKLSGFKGNSTFTTWLRVITTHYCIDQLRERQQRQALYQRYVEEMVLIDYSLEADEMSFQLMQQAIQQLSIQERAILQLKYANSLTLQCIAHQQSLSLSAVKMRIKRASDQARSQFARLLVTAT